ncbi:unnamed protein product [Mytilus coruscus]|uniref:Apple domain-containing protein n=1 Tax=Mytilus coruscus TaxID=42192 RepID=A0A6J8AJT3_MYTCO|nr:unnamed protein product [Mytilus coruscus]
MIAGDECECEVSCPDLCSCSKQQTSCISRNLTSIPNGIFEKTERLILKSNNIKDIPPGVFSTLQILDHLILKENDIETIRNDTFSDLGKLTILSLESNKITELAAKAFRSLTNLTLLNLAENFIKAIKEEVFFGLHNLNELYLGDNDIESIHNETFRGLHNLQVLHLSRNNIRLVEKGVFRGLYELEELLMAFNLLNDISGLFEDLKELKRLDLSENRLICNCALVSLKDLYIVLNHGDGIMCTETTGLDLGNVPDYDLCTNKGDYCRRENVTIINGHSIDSVYGVSVIRCAFMCDAKQECNAFQHLNGLQRVCNLWSIGDKTSWLTNVTRYVDIYERC